MVIVSSACRALADQLEGNEEEHEKYRHMVVQYIMKNREMFEPFIEDDVPFDEYCQSMGKDGTWAGHMELQAASLVTQNNICIHRDMSPRWYIRNFENQRARMIHLSYHDGEHYNSVRLKEDQCSGPAMPVIIKQVHNKQNLQLLNQKLKHRKMLSMEELLTWLWQAVVVMMVKKLSRFYYKWMVMLMLQLSS